MLDLIHDLTSYLKQPYLARIPQKTEKPFILLLKLALICLMAGISGGILLSILIGLKLIPSPGPSLIEKKEMAKPLLFIMAVVWAPLSEELLFRAQLRRFTGSLLFISFICGAFLSAIIKTDWAFLISPLVFIVLYLIYRYNLARSVTLKFEFWERIFPWHFHLTAICFALIHLSNFEKGISLLPLGILYTLPQLAVGLVLGYARMNYGLKYSFALHALYNFFPVLLFIAKY
ncbi:membrane protease YdiL (CAAX protease family) [Pedobacter cryoconitis]|uniref:Membrane protease YdiL (CAAX protease family) n=1 Tax=Pedobacter cryoconitis TaxID=188932 RepID=A0A7W9DXR6_9SPHI|nr:CPBP family glutamic-type intramembrane protease [Pedobacter cryoconitis]MBB5635407.1 membrane protease YdiL (CAAX protease family) [Pedobacter cryoconitis]